jgi:type IV pilus assembly protein PilQ
MAFVEAGERIPYQTVEDDDISIEWQDATLRLEVTPHVIDDKTIKLDIVIHKDEVDFSRTVLGNPTIITRKEETTLIINDGQTIVIGGISKETDLGASEGVPFLKDLPGLGNLFKNDLKDARLEEMLIFITARILKENVAGQ